MNCERPKSNLSTSDGMHQIRQQKQTTARSNFVQNVESIPSRRGIENQQITQSSVQIKALIDDVNQLANTVNKNNRRFIENDRRLTRIEVTLNKTFVMLGDLTNAINTRMSLVGNSNSLCKEDKLPRGFHMPRLPIDRLKELTIINRDLKNEEFFNILVSYLLLVRYKHIISKYQALQEI